MTDREEFGELIVMDESGDRRLRWRRSKKKTTTAEVTVDITPPPAEEPADVRQARRHFDEHVGRGGKAWRLNRVNGAGRLLEQSSQATTFDPDATYLLGEAPERGKS